MADTVAQLIVEITARLDKLEKSLSEAESKARESADKIDGEMQKGPVKAMAGVAAMAAKVFVALEGVKTAAIAAQGAINASSAAMALMRGDSADFMKNMEGVADSIEKIPLLGGLLAGAADEIVNLLALTNDVIQELEELEKQAAQVNKERPFLEMAKDLARTNDLIEMQIEIAEATTDSQRRFKEFALQRMQLEDSYLKKIEEVMKNTEKDSDVRRVALAALAERNELEQELIDAKETAAREAEVAAKKEEDRRAREAKNRADQLEKERRAREALRIFEREKREADRKALADAREYNQQLTKRNRLEQKNLKEMLQSQSERADQISSRLGIASQSGGGSKSGLTQSGNTAMGQFTFGEHGAQDKIAKLTKEANGIQKNIESITKRLEGLVRDLANKIGFK